MTRSAVLLPEGHSTASDTGPIQSLHWDEGHDYYRDFLSVRRAWQLFNTLKEELNWQQKTIRVFGRDVMQPRLMCWQGDTVAKYGYSGLSLAPEPWHPDLNQLRYHLQQTLGLPFNSVLANAYRHGQDSMGWHSDDEKELGSKPAIASISLGTDRIFRIRRKGDRQSRGITLHHGSLLLMTGCSQERFQHALPKSSRINDWRINLTFRQIIQAKA